MSHTAACLSVASTLVLLAGLTPHPEPVKAGDRPAARMHGHGWEDEDHSYDRARRASEAGEILTIAEIYERARQAMAGRILEAELERKHGRWVYELKILDPQGRLFELYLDAASGQVLKQEKEDD
jgi:uncharacterized membrane protein YkoI